VVPGGLDLRQRLGEAPRREDVGEGESALLEELLPEGVDLLAKTPGRWAPHRSGSRLEKECTYPNQSQDPEIVLSRSHAVGCENLRAIRRIDRRIFRHMH